MSYGYVHRTTHAENTAEIFVEPEQAKKTTDENILVTQESQSDGQKEIMASNSDETGISFAYTKETLESAYVGGKAANMQKLNHVKAIAIPPWLILSTKIFQQFLEENDLIAQIIQLDTLCQTPQENAESIKTLAAKIQSCVNEQPLSKALFLKIKDAYEKLCSYTDNSQASFAVRSSGIIEDSSTSSCAGLYDTELNVNGVENIITAVKSVWASSFNLRVIQERMRLKINQTHCQMGVIVQEQINARASGVVSTLVLGNNYPGIQVSGNYGVGESVVSGEVSVDGWVVHPTKDYILEAIKGSKETCHSLVGHKGVEKVSVSSSDRDAFVLNREELSRLTTQVKKIKDHYGCDVDIEYAVDQKGKLFILQARPLVNIQANNVQVIDVKNSEELSVIGRGHFSVAGVASGRLVFVNSLDQLESGEIILDPQDIVLAYITTNVWSQYLGHIKGLITREGSPSSHPILLSREKQIPCVIGVADGFEKLVAHAGQTVTIDGFNKCVYSGDVPTKEASQDDLLKQFEPVSIRQWPELATALPHLIHNKMAVESEGTYWRRTPTYPVTGFQMELNILRFDLVPSLLKKEGDVKILSKVIDGYTCCELSPFSDYVALFDGFGIDEATEFNHSHQDCIHAFLNASQTCTRSKEDWKVYIDTYAQLRSYIWLGDALRSYAQRKTEEMGAQIELPAFYLEECAKEIQAAIPELDAQMHQELYELATQFQSIPFVDNVEILKIEHEELYRSVEILGRKYRFEHGISLDKELDLNVVYTRLKREIEVISKGKIFSTDKTTDSSRTLLPEMPELTGWLGIAIWNRILQSDSHHIDARAKEIARPQIKNVGQMLIEKGNLKSSEDVFNYSIEEMGEYIREFSK